MGVWESFNAWFLDTSNTVVVSLVGVFFIVGLLNLAARVFVGVRKIQRRKYDRVIFRHEITYALLTLIITTTVLKVTISYLTAIGVIVVDPAPISAWRVAVEFAIYFFFYDATFYFVHRLMHINEWFYKWVHKTHHHSVVPNALSAFAVHPVESVILGLITVLFLCLFTVHSTSAIFIMPFAALMGFYVHAGYDFFPKWWYRVWWTKWLQTPTFHDQHHQYFSCNYAGFTTIWDRLFGTLRARFQDDFERAAVKHR